MTKTVSVRAPARLHLGFLDLNASLGRKFGSIGLTINSHHTQLKISAASENRFTGAALNDETRHRLLKLKDRFYETLGRDIAEQDQTIAVELKQRIPEHAGLGSGTQLALTFGTALAKFHGIDANTADIAQHLGRGSRSGIGIAGFDHGGFIIDGGLKPGQTVPPVLIQHTFPSSWRIVLIMDLQAQGVHGKKETQAFQTLPEFPLPQAQAICHLTLMRLLPALMEQDLDNFGSAITEIQALVGDHFAAAQGGRYASSLVAACLERAQQLGYSGIAQSSWGPTGCVFVDSDDAAEKLIRQLRDDSPHSEALLFLNVEADDNGAIIETST